MTYVNISVFLGIFTLVSYSTVKSPGAAPNVLLSRYFTQATTSYKTLLLNARHYCSASNVDQLLHLVARIYASSFLKDALFATLAPKLQRSAVSSKLINKVERDTFNEDWIPASNYDQFARKSMLTKSVVNKAESTGKNISRRTSVYIVGHGLIKLAVNLTQVIIKYFKNYFN